jgi:hypothetical protein
LKNGRSIKHPGSFYPKGNNRIFHLIRTISDKRGESSAQKVFQVLEKWQEQGKIFCWEENKKWGYGDCILHEDGWFMNLEGDQVAFQITSSYLNAKEHLEKYPHIPVIIVSSGISLEDLGKKMEEIFKERMVFPDYLKGPGPEHC